eukprot:TRINITY_DN9341_c0_g1_i14.p1 TRINITY_DN9341_c0_g1~~TRINITY_DN9341_c0_g1_i14.p1  ORF type:complete len:480 (-),score=71.52 TRINITY_DN9341_c0_g1_i14:340-1695(-)
MCIRDRADVFKNLAFEEENKPIVYPSHPDFFEPGIQKRRHKKSLSEDHTQKSFYSYFLKSSPPDDLLNLIAPQRKKESIDDSAVRFLEDDTFSMNPFRSAFNLRTSNFNASTTDSSLTYNSGGPGQNPFPGGASFKPFPPGPIPGPYGPAGPGNAFSIGDFPGNPQIPPRQRNALNPAFKNANLRVQKAFFNDNLSFSEQKLYEGPSGQPQGLPNMLPKPGLGPEDSMAQIFYSTPQGKKGPQAFPLPEDLLGLSLGDGFMPFMDGAGGPPGMAGPSSFDGLGSYSARGGNGPDRFPWKVQGDEALLGSGRKLNPGAFPLDFGFNMPKQTPERRKPIVIDESKSRYTGRLKFFDENKNYGFIIMDEDGSDIFVHYDDLCKANISKEMLKAARQGLVIKLSFSCMSYIGKYDKSRKAVEIQLLQQYELVRETGQQTATSRVKLIKQIASEEM